MLRSGYVTLLFGADGKERAVRASAHSALAASVFLTAEWGHYIKSKCPTELGDGRGLQTDKPDRKTEGTIHQLCTENL